MYKERIDKVASERDTDIEMVRQRHTNLQRHPLYKSTLIQKRLRQRAQKTDERKEKQ